MPRISVDNLNSPKSTAVSSQPVPSSKTNSQNPVAPPEVSNSNGEEVNQILKDKSGGILSAFHAFPDDIIFQGEEDNEKIILLLRQHVITNVPWIVITILLFLAPLLLFPLLFMFGIFPNVPYGFRFIMTLFWYMATFSYALINFLYWYFNVYIITEERVIDVDWYSLIYRRVITAQISKIQDVSNSIGGVVRSIFDFGLVHIETAGDVEEIEFVDIPHPALVAQELEKLMEMEENESELHPSV